MNASAIEVYEIFKENLKLGEEKASMVIKYLENSTEEKISNEIKSKVEHLATKEDINELRSELKEDIVANREEILKSESSLREEILKLETAMSKKHFDIIKWMFVFWVGAVGSIIGVMAFLN